MDTKRRFPVFRGRRMRQHYFSRRLVQEARLGSQDFIYPVFIHDRPEKQVPVASMPGVYRHNLDGLKAVAEQCLDLGIPAIALFPVIDAAQKSLDAREAFNPQGLVPKALQAIKQSFPSLGLITDIALDPYTSHGQDGLINGCGHILNEPTVEVLRQQALCHAQAGADVVAPSDMMDGRIGAIRQSLDEHHCFDTMILSYAAKYASAFYGPFRDAVGSAAALGQSSKETYQMDPANSDEALHEVAMDLEEGADLVMVKPGLPYLDIIYRVKQQFGVPTFAYQVSGEYAMIKAASGNLWLPEKKTALEALLCLKRAGADGILTYYALEAAAWLKSDEAYSC
jgi:porphobilinogen synthase